MEKKKNNNDRQSKFVTADEIGEHYSCSGRYILKLAAKGKVPSLRLGKRCVRFEFDAVAAALEGGAND